MDKFKLSHHTIPFISSTKPTTNFRSNSTLNIIIKYYKSNTKSESTTSVSGTKVLFTDRYTWQNFLLQFLLR